MSNSIKYSILEANISSIICTMSKHKDLIRELLHKFVSASIYMLMAIVAVFIFYKAMILIVFVIFAMIEEVKHLPAMFAWELNTRELLSIVLAEQILNVVTFLLVFVKSFKILKSYSLHHHIEIKDLLEISIIALLMEVVFNFGIHSMGLNILFSILGVVLIILYATLPYFRKK